MLCAVGAGRRDATAWPPYGKGRERLADLAETRLDAERMRRAEEGGGAAAWAKARHRVGKGRGESILKKTRIRQDIGRTVEWQRKLHEAKLKRRSASKSSLELLQDRLKDVQRKVEEL